MKTDNALGILIKFTELLNIPVNGQQITDELLSHPYYPSLLAISDVLKTLNVDNVAFHVNDDELLNIPCPFVTQIHGDFAIVNRITAETVTISNEGGVKRKLSFTEFSNIGTRVILAAETAENSSVFKNLQTLLIKLKFPIVITGLTVVFVSIVGFHTEYVATVTLQVLLLTVFKSAGLLISMLLLIQLVDNDNPLIQKVCRNGNQMNCSAILSSNAAKVFRGLSWSEVGFFYFAGSWLLLLFGGGSLAIRQILGILNLISLPYTIFSIYYQARVAKQWCILCCTVQAILWMEFVTFISYDNLFIKIDQNIPWNSVMISFILPVILWTLLKPLFQKTQQLLPLKQELQKFKYNTKLFNNILAEGKFYPEASDDWCIVLGNAEADNVITMVSNPYCQPCAKAHKSLDELLKQNGNVKARIVFTADNTDADIKTPISRHLIALSYLPDKSIIKKGLHDWYEQRNYETWAKNYPVQINDVSYHNLDKQHVWCQETEVIATPTILLNGYNLSNSYQLSDLKYMLEQH